MIIQLQKTHMKLCHHMLEIVHLQDTCIYRTCLMIFIIYICHQHKKHYIGIVLNYKYIVHVVTVKLNDNYEDKIISFLYTIY